MTQSWYSSFERWTREESPTGEWVYRGQAARYASIVPSLMRPGQREHHPSRGLFDLDYDVARAVFEASPAFGEGGLHEVISDPFGATVENIAGMLGQAPAIHPQLSFAELVRALAQHYDYPTLFVDVSFHPVVSALFATHVYGDEGYEVSKEEAALFRWPATRKSPHRGEIRGSVGEESVSIGLIDIRRIHPLMRRPSTQHAALATPVFDLKPIFQPFQSSIEELKCTDLAQLDCCQRFDLPGGAGSSLTRSTGVRMEGLFPDRVDLGFSYLALIALLSLTVHRPRADDDEGVAASLNRMFDETIRYANALLDRECYRLDSRSGVTLRSQKHTLVDIETAIHIQSERARRAAEMMWSPALHERARKALEKKRAALQDVANVRFDAWKKAMREVRGDEAAEALGSRPEITVTPLNNDWVVAEIDRRLTRVERLLATADWLPVWALDDPQRADGLRAVFYSDDEYESSAANLIAANRNAVRALDRFGV